jgi:hypothetical protein
MRWVTCLFLIGGICSGLNPAPTDLFAADHIRATDADSEVPDVLYVDDDAPAGEDGSSSKPYKTIQKAIDQAHQTRPTTIYVRSGVYTGEGNRDIDFHGKPVYLEALFGVAATTIDCQRLGRAFHFHSGEGRDSIVSGFTISNCLDQPAGAVLCERSSPTIEMCRFQNQSDDMVRLTDSSMRLSGTIEGEGAYTFIVDANSTLELDQCQCSCSVRGAGRLKVSAGGESVFYGDAAVRMQADTEDVQTGRVDCVGWLVMAERAGLVDSRIDIVPSGYLLIAEQACVSGNDIYIQADDCIAIDPSWSEGSLADNKLYVRIQGTQTGQVFEVRGKDIYHDPDYIQPSVPPLSAETWTLERLELTESARLNLADRFADQGPTDEGEALYVKTLVLGPNAVLNAGANALYCEDISGVHETAQIRVGGTQRRPPSFLLGRMTFDNPDDYANRVVTSEFESEGYVTRVVGEQPDPNGMLSLSSDWFRDGRAKVCFGRCNEMVLSIQFDYLFTQDVPGAELVVALSDVYWPLEPGSELWDEHCLEVARIPAPSLGQPGSVGSGSFGRFRQQVHIPTEDRTLDLSRETWVELALLYPWVPEDYGLALYRTGLRAAYDTTTARVFADELVVTVECHGICMDLSGDNATDTLDLMVAVAACGRSTTPGEDAEILSCIDRGFCRDYRVDCADIVSWDWALGHCERSLPSGCGNLCGRDGMDVPLVTDAVSVPTSVPSWTAMSWGPTLADPSGKLLILAKKSVVKGWMAELTFEDHLSAYDSDLSFQGDPNISRPPSRYNIRLVTDDRNRAYVVNSAYGLLPLDDPCHPVLSPQAVCDIEEPLYGGCATVYVGLQGQFPDAYGRPILDAAFHDGFIYVAPVVIRPSDPEKSSYLAAARLTTATGTCHIEELYANRDPVNLSDGIREIEVDGQSNVYVLNAFGLNQSDCIVRYGADGSTTRRSLCSPVIETEEPISDPIGLCVSQGGELIVASGSYDKTSPGVVKVYVFSAEDLFRNSEHVACRAIRVWGMHHVTAITADDDGDIWVLGYDVDDKSTIYDETTATCPYACLARIRKTDAQVTAEDLSVRQASLGLPMSIIRAGRTAYSM